jgi:hypothetical protein
VACLTENAVVGLAAGTLPAAEAEAARTHVDACDDCRALLTAALEATRAPKRAATEPLLAGAGQLGRYFVLGPVGAGAMGVVYSAYDPQLDRRVALKLVRGGGDPEHAARVLREAQAMARLSHPNVVAVHDVGTVEGRVFIAMDFVEGQSLAAWLRAERRPWR